jgi:hypothetical protein
VALKRVNHFLNMREFRLNIEGPAKKIEINKAWGWGKGWGSDQVNQPNITARHTAVPQALSKAYRGQAYRGQVSTIDKAYRGQVSTIDNRIGYGILSEGNGKAPEG